MIKTIWKNSVKSICAVELFSESDVRIISFSGFKVSGALLTDEYLMQISNAHTVKFTFYNEDGSLPFLTFNIPYKKLIKYLITMDDSPGFTVIDPTIHPKLSEIPSLELNLVIDKPIGEEVITIHHQPMLQALSMSKSIVSSFLNECGINFMQLSSPIKPGYAGCPIIQLESGKVIGMARHKLAMINESHKKMKKIMQNNLELLKSLEGKIFFESIDPIQVLIAGQNQLKYMSQQLINEMNCTFPQGVEIKRIISYLNKELHLTMINDIFRN